MRRALLTLAFWAAGTCALADVQPTTCAIQSHKGAEYTVCTVNDPSVLNLHLKGDDGEVIGSFRRLEATQGPLPFAMNAGMYHPDRSPVGYYVEDGVEIMRVIPNAGPGNFGLLPNGVLCITPSAVRVIETLAFQQSRPSCVHASQSGPMFVIDGKLHPRFLPQSNFTNIRNGVGTAENGKIAYFVMSNGAVTFHQMALFFRDALKTPNALYFDGRISKLHAPSLGRSDIGQPMGPIISASH